LVAATATAPPASAAPVNRTRKRSVGSSLHRTLAHHQDPLLDQRSGNCRPRSGEDSGKGRSGNSHPLCGGFLVKTFEIGQPKSFELVQAQRLDLKFADRTADGFERSPPGHATDPPELFRSCHFISQLRTYVHN